MDKIIELLKKRQQEIVLQNPKYYDSGAPLESRVQGIDDAIHLIKAHHLTTSSPSNSGGKSAEDVFNELNKIRDVSFNEPQLDLLFEVAHTYASQFPQPQLVSGVRTKEEIRDDFIKDEDLNTSGSNSVASPVASQSPVGSSLDGATISKMEIVQTGVSSTCAKNTHVQDDKGIEFDTFPIWLTNLIKSYDNYENILNAEINELAGYALVHGWQSKRVEEGQHARELIASAMEDIPFLVNRELNVQERDATKADSTTVSGEHHPTQEIEGEKVYRWVIDELKQWLGEKRHKVRDIEFKQGISHLALVESFGGGKEAIDKTRKEIEELEFAIYVLDRGSKEIPLSTHTSEGREAIELDGNDVMSVIEFYRTNQNIYFNTQNKKVYENNAEITLGRLRQLYNIYLKGKGREGLVAGGSNSDSASVVTPHSSAGNSSEQ